jgi:hypothetical protein
MYATADGGSVKPEPKKRLTPDQWAAIRLEWEGDPLATFNGMAQKHGVDVASVSRHASREGWSKRNQLGDINEAANRRADAQCNANGDASETQRPNTASDLATRDESEAVRAAVLVRLRAEWAELEGFRKAALAAMKTAHTEGDKAAWSIAKMAADTALSNIRALSVKQEGERKAWGLDAKSEEEIIITNPRRIEV